MHCEFMRLPYSEIIHDTIYLVLGGRLTHLRVWVRRLRTRNQLRELDARLLQDVGITPDEQARECAKPFWK
jgi:uncharacterized protein YjiS (DUF1127 family)